MKINDPPAAAAKIRSVLGEYRVLVGSTSHGRSRSRVQKTLSHACELELKPPSYEGYWWQP